METWRGRGGRFALDRRRAAPAAASSARRLPPADAEEATPWGQVAAVRISSTRARRRPKNSLRPRMYLARKRLEKGFLQKWGPGLSMRILRPGAGGRDAMGRDAVVAVDFGPERRQRLRCPAAGFTTDCPYFSAAMATPLLGRTLMVTSTGWRTYQHPRLASPEDPSARLSSPCGSCHLLPPRAPSHLPATADI